MTAGKSLDLQYSLPVTADDKGKGEAYLGAGLDDGLDEFFNNGMAHTGGSSPFIKDEPEDFSSLFSNNYGFNQKGFDMQANQNYTDHHPANVDPSALAIQNGNFNQFGMGGQQNVSNNFNMGNSGFHDDELLDFELNGDTQANFQQGHQGQNNLRNLHLQQGTQGQSNQMFSNTPDGAPIQSPFNHQNFNYAFNQMSARQMSHMSQNPTSVQGQSLDTGSMNVARAKSHHAAMTDRQGSDSKSPMTPHTPGVSALQLNTPDSGSLGSRTIQGNYHDERRLHNSGQWEANAGSLPSAVGSPLVSPAYQANHPQISDILKSGKHASLPDKVDPSHQTPFQTQEAKRRRRRESHNQVERRRRDNINEKIHELSELVPMHRLEDEKLRKHLMSNSPISPSLVATGMSPPQATSLLAGGGRRAAGGLSVGIPPEEKDKGPNKGDILNGSVSWTRDLMWALHVKYQQETELAEYITNLGGTWPFQQSEDEKRMQSELVHAMDRNNASSFSYTRGPGSGLRVPHYTNAAGEALDATSHTPQDQSPDNIASGDGDNGGRQQQQYWQPTFKEEDEYGMEMN